jgi:hypothetical protein
VQLSSSMLHSSIQKQKHATKKILSSMHIVWNSMLRSRIYQHHPSHKQIWIRNQASGCRCNSSFHFRNKESLAVQILLGYWIQLYNGYKRVHFIVQELNSDSSKPSCTSLLSQKKGGLLSTFQRKQPYNVLQCSLGFKLLEVHSWYCPYSKWKDVWYMMKNQQL